MEIKDYGSQAFVANIENLTKTNTNYRTAIWTGKLLQITLMHIPVGEDIGLEQHPDNDQFLRLEAGRARVQMGDTAEQLDFDVEAEDDFAIVIPAGKWHNVTNIGDEALKIYSIYAPVHHPAGTVHETKAIADAAEAEEHQH